MSLSICKCPNVSLSETLSNTSTVSLLRANATLSEAQSETMSPSLSTLTVTTQSQPKRGDSSQQVNPKTQPTDGLAVPYMYRRESGRYYYRLRPTGSLSLTASVSLGTTERVTAMRRYNHLSATMKAFMLDNDSATFEELRAHLKTIAQSFLNDKAEDYWSGVEVDHLSDAKSDLREIAATQPLNDNQHRVIIEALSVLSAAQQRVNKGNAQPLLDSLSALTTGTSLSTSKTTSNSIGLTNENNTQSIGVATSILSDDQGSYPTVFTESTSKPVTFSVLVADLLAEKVLTLKPASMKDLESTLRTIAKYVPDGMALMSRVEWLSVRDSMVAAGLAASTINKAMTKAKMLLDYGLMNGKLSGRNPVERMKLTGAESQRKAFSEDQMVSLTDGLATVTNDNQRYLVALGAITGARIGELTQLTPEDIVMTEGYLCVSINESNGKTVKNKASIREVPLTDGAYGFNLEDFKAYVETCETGKPLLNMTRDTASKWFNEVYMRSTLSDCENVSFHSMRHSMATTLKAAGVSLTDSQGVLGHSSQSITFELYGKGHAIKRLADALSVLPGASSASGTESPVCG